MRVTTTRMPAGTSDAARSNRIVRHPSSASTPIGRLATVTDGCFPCGGRAASVPLVSGGGAVAESDDDAPAESVDELPVAAAEAPGTCCPLDPQAGSTASAAAQRQASAILGMRPPRI